MRVLILSQFFEPEPLPKAMELAQGMIARGHSVYVITGFPNYPAGRLYPGYRLRLFQRETIRGVPVVRTALFPSHGTSVLGRFANYGSFMLSSVLGAFLTPKCDVMYVWHPPLTVGVSAWIIGKLKGIPFVYDVQDIWPESGVWSGMVKGRLLFGLMRGLERFVYRKADHLYVVTERARQNLIGKGVPPEKVSIGHHLLDEGLFTQAQKDRSSSVRERFSFADRFVVMYTGNMGLVQGLDVALDAAAVLKDRDPQVLVVLVGDGTDRPRLKAKAASLSLTNVLFVDSQPAKEMPNFVANASALLLTLKDSEVAELAVPLKTFAYLASGRPIVAALKGSAADLIGAAGAGLVADPRHPEELAEAILRLKAMPETDREAMGARGRSHLMTHLDKQKLLDDYARRLMAEAEAAVEA